MSTPVLRPQFASTSATNVARVILSVDDEALVLHTRQKVLEAAGYTVLNASDGEQALGFFAAVMVDLVLLDYAMPGIDGGRVAREMKASRPLVPIILVTGLRLEGQTLPYVDWIYEKGEDPGLLLAKIRQLLASPEVPGERANKTEAATLQVLGVYRPLVSDALFEAQNKLYEDETQTRLHFDKLVLVEAMVHGTSDFKIDDLGQETPEYGNQIAYNGALLNGDGSTVIMNGNGRLYGTPPLRCAFYLHFYDPQFPLRWTHGEIRCPAVEEIPERLQQLVPYSPVD